MKKIIICTIALISILLTGTVYASVYSFEPSPRRLGYLDHSFYYYWEINGTSDLDGQNLAAALQNGETINSASLSIGNIYNSSATTANDNKLFINLADSKPTNDNPMQVGGNVYKYADGITGIENNLVGGISIGAWSDPTGGFNNRTNLAFDFNQIALASLSQYAGSNDFKFFIGFDPDCLYLNSGATLFIETSQRQTTSVPEPGTLLLLGSGLIGLAFASSRRRKG